MTLRPVVAVFTAIPCALAGSKQGVCLPAQQSDPPAAGQPDLRADFRQGLQTLARLTPDPCDPPLDPVPPDVGFSGE